MRIHSKSNLVVLFIFVIISTFFLNLKPAQAEGSTYYLAINNSNARDRPSYGTKSNPWKTFEYALLQLGPGDTLIIRGGTYTAFSKNLFKEHSGTESAPITVKAYSGERPVIKSHETKLIKFDGTQWWTFEGLAFRSQSFVLGGSMNSKAKHITFRKCVFRNSNYTSLRIKYAEDILVEKTKFRKIQSMEAGRDISAITVPYYVNNLVIRKSRFQDISSDGIHLGRNQIAIKNVLIEDNKFYIRRNSDGTLMSRNLQRKWGNTGENAIDIKEVDGPITIRGNEIYGFMPTVPGQNASGANGEGIVIHFGARNVLVEQNYFHDNAQHLTITTDKGRRTESITVRNNIFKDAKEAKNDGVWVEGWAMAVRDAAYIDIYHNTFYKNDVIIGTRNVYNSNFKNNISFKGRTSLRDSKWNSNYNAWSQLSGKVADGFKGGNDIYVDRLRLNDDLSPRGTSPVINKGATVGVVKDYRGTTRDSKPDMGAYEYKGVSATPAEQTIQINETASYEISFNESPRLAGTVTLNVDTPSEDLDINFNAGEQVSPGESYILDVSKRSIDDAQIVSSQTYTIPIQATNGITTETVDVILTIGTSQEVYLPMVVVE